MKINKYLSMHIRDRSIFVGGMAEDLHNSNKNDAFPPQILFFACNFTFVPSDIEGKIAFLSS